jgi:hypothetical protein
MFQYQGMVDHWNVMCELFMEHKLFSKKLCTTFQMCKVYRLLGFNTM